MVTLNAEEFLGRAIKKSRKKESRASRGGPSNSPHPEVPDSGGVTLAPVPLAMRAPQGATLADVVIRIEDSPSGEAAGSTPVQAEVPRSEARGPQPEVSAAEATEAPATEDPSWMASPPPDVEGPEGQPLEASRPEEGSIRASEARSARGSEEAAGPSKKRKRKKKRTSVVQAEGPLVTGSGEPLRSGGSAPGPTETGRGEKGRFWSDPGPRRSPAIGDNISVRGMPRASGLNEARSARQLVRAIQIPRDREIMNSLSLGELLDQSMLDVVRHAHSAAHLHDTVLSQAKLLRKASSDRRELEDQFRSSREMLREEREKSEALQKSEEETRAAFERARRTELEANARLIERMDLVEKLKDQNKELRVQIAVNEERFAEMSRAIAAAEDQLSARAEEFEGKSAEAEQLKIKLAEAEELLKKKEEETNRLRSEFELFKSEALEKAKQDYLASASFKEEMIECASDAYIKGYDGCLLKVKQGNPSFDVSKFVLGGSDEEDDEDEG